MSKKILFITVLTVLLMLVTSPFVFAAYTGSPPSPSSGGTGTTVSWSPGGFDQGETVNFYFCSQRIFVGSATANEIGTASITFAIPSNSDTGDCTLRGLGDRSGTEVTTTFTVTGAGTTGLAYTGAQILFWLMAGAALIAIGVAFVKRQQVVS
jgi:hypothetical protein